MSTKIINFMCYLAHMQRRDMFRKISCDEKTTKKKRTTYWVCSLYELLTTALLQAGPVAGDTLFATVAKDSWKKKKHPTTTTTTTQPTTTHTHTHLSTLSCLSVSQSVCFRGIQSSGYEEFCLRRYNAALSVEGQPTFKRNTSHPSLGSKNKPSK
jgi:hypothetical protein